MQRIGFGNKPLRDMVAVGRVDSGSARLWMRSERRGRILVRWGREDHRDAPRELSTDLSDDGPQERTGTVCLPGEDNPPLEPATPYRYRILHTVDGHTLGEGRFETSPLTPEETPSRFTIALMSGHQPYDPKGNIREAAAQMLKASLRCIREYDTKFALLTGNQLYSASPQPLSLLNPRHLSSILPPDRKSLLDCTESEVRRIYHRRYRHFWNIPEWQKIQAEIPCYPLPGEHDLLSAPRGSSLHRGARWAYYDYQGSRMDPSPDGTLPASFDYSLTYGHTAFFALDLCSASEGNPLFGEAQEEQLRHFLARQSDKKVILLALSDPLLHRPTHISNFLRRLPQIKEIFPGRWSSDAQMRDRDRLLSLIHDHRRSCPQQRFLLLCGGLYSGGIQVLNWDDHAPPVHQLLSCPITHPTGLLLQAASRAVLFSGRKLTTGDGALSLSTRRLRGKGKNPSGGMNLGLVEIISDSSEEPPKIRFHLFGHQEGNPVTIYVSPVF